jgi:hypothetical protein
MMYRLKLNAICNKLELPKEDSVNHALTQYYSIRSNLPDLLAFKRFLATNLGA